MSNIVWLPWMIEKLREQYPDGDTKGMALMFGVSRLAVNAKASELRIKKSETFLKEQRKKAIELCAGTRFKPGHESWNKGKAGSITITEGMKKNWFPSGHKPHNTTFDGCISKITDKQGRTQLKIRISETRHEYLSRHNYRKAFGAIPNSHMIKFKDGNTLNCDPSNLECVSKTLNMLMNSKHGYTREIAEVKEDDCKVIVGDVYWHEVDEHGCNWNISTIQNGSAYINDILRIIAVKRQSIDMKVDS